MRGGAALFIFEKKCFWETLYEQWWSGLVIRTFVCCLEDLSAFSASLWWGWNRSRAGRWQGRWGSQPCQHSWFFHPTATAPRWNKKSGGKCLKNTIAFSSQGCWCWKVQRKRERGKNVKMKLKILLLKKESITGNSCVKVKEVYLQRRMHRGCCCERGRTLAVAFCRHSLLLMASCRLKHTCLKVFMLANIKNDIRDVGSIADLVLVFLVHLVHWYPLVF